MTGERRPPSDYRWARQVAALLLIIAGVVIRAGVFAPAAIERMLDGEDEPGS